MRSPLPLYPSTMSDLQLVLTRLLNAMLTCNHIKPDPATPTEKGYHRGHEDRKEIDIGFVECELERVITELKQP